MEFPWTYCTSAYPADDLSGSPFFISSIVFSPCCCHCFHLLFLLLFSYHFIFNPFREIYSIYFNAENEMCILFGFIFLNSTWFNFLCSVLRMARWIPHTFFFGGESQWLANKMRFISQVIVCIRFPFCFQWIISNLNYCVCSKTVKSNEIESNIVKPKKEKNGNENKKWIKYKSNKQIKPCKWMGIDKNVYDNILIRLIVIIWIY